jgi:transcriptional regulator with XRE-family HTH domain
MADLEFSKRLRRLMAAKRLSQSDLAREIWGEEITPAGYMAARGRDKINKYCAGKMVPDPPTLTLLARALGVLEIELAPQVVTKLVEREHPEIRLRAVEGNPGLVHLAWDTMLPLHAVTQMLTVYQNTDTYPVTEAMRKRMEQPASTADAALAEVILTVARMAADKQ